MKKLIEIINENNLGKDLRIGNFGIEKESLRVNEKGELSLTDHPKIFGDKEKNPYITVDFSESQIEMITPVEDSIEKAYSFLRNIHEIVTLNLENEFLWNQSVPPRLPKSELIPIGKFPNNKKAEEYRENLAKKHGKKKQLLSGIHFNFSFKDELLEELYEKIDEDISFQDFKNEIYLKISRNYFKYGWIIIYLLGASPLVDKTYKSECIEHMKGFDKDTYYFEDGVSFRNGVCGYKNQEKFYIDHTNIESYLKSLEVLIDKGILQGAREYYSPIRLKGSDPKDILNSLRNDGIKYLELRSIDLNPFNDIGIDKRDLEFIHLLLLFLLLKEDEEFNEEDYYRYLKNQELLATLGNGKDFNLICCKGKKISPKEQSENILKWIEETLIKSGYFTEKDKKILKYQKEKLNNNLYTDKILKETKEKGFIPFQMDDIKRYLESFKEKEYTLKGYEDLELSTQILIKDAIKRGVKFEILDRKENFIMLESQGNVQYVKQATKTSLDSYVTMLIMENKVVTKKVLEKVGVVVPSGKSYTDIESAKRDFKKYSNSIVIKPKSTNFGLGITIFTKSFTKDDYDKAIDMAFKEDDSILIEKFIKGKEYRIFVVEDEVVGILHRVPANVIGDGHSTITKLVEIKNQDPLRGKGYKTPLEKIKLEEPEALFLKGQGLSFESIPKKNETVYLRENSNISTGGDSLDYTDEIPNIYKKIAVEASKAAGAKICGVDMMIDNIKNENPQENYAIIEINFNPAIHIHCYPYKGKNRKLGDKILKALGY